ncbi:VOC family protein [Parablastomonas sp. CN1-191]|uniref:VOC family protein n=1 Tax=Parablastomonas sp. CN1-191 TaxID=3400908 RepID=UPI003BF7BD3F
MSGDSGGFIWYELVTPDPDGAKAFYDAVVSGWSIEAAPAGPMDYRMINRADGGHAGGVLRLSEEMAQGGMTPRWLGYVHVPDVDAALAAMTVDGATTLMDHDGEPGRIALIADPQGVAIYVMTPRPPAGNPDAKSDVYDRMKPGHVGWNELYTTDLDAAKAFYGKHFGWTFERSMPMGEEFGDYVFIEHGGQDIGAMMKKPPQAPAAAWGYYITVADIDAAQRAITAGGGHVFHGPQEVPGGQWIVNAVDPQGAAFACVGARAA